MLRIHLVVTTIVAATLATATPAPASVAGEQHAGQALAGQVRSGERSCNSLSPQELDHIGEFVMGRMIGSPAAHEAMNARMVAVMGENAESRMHQVLGARFAGCNTSSDGNAYGAMMGDGRDWNWMMGGRWQHMSSAEWQAVQQRLLGTATTHNADDNGVSTLDVVLIGLGVAAVCGLVGLSLARRTRRGDHA